MAVAALLLAAALAHAAPAAAQDTLVVRLRATYDTRAQPGLVVLPFAGERAAGQARDIVWRDRDFSNRFTVRDGTGARPGEAVNAALWKERGADWVVDGAVAARPGGLTLRLTLHDAVYGRVRGQHDFPLPPAGTPDFRMAVHAASDAVVRWATGEPGIAATRIAYVLQGRGSKEIYVVDSDGENPTRVTSDGTLALSPAWSPDGGRIAYTSWRGGSPFLYERNLSNGRDRVLSDRDGLNITPAYAPDGRTVAFATTVDGNTEIATVGDGGLRQQTRGRRFDSLSPSFSPDGRRMAFVSNRLGEPQIYVMDVGGGEPRLVSDYAYGRRGYATSPEWSPTGTAIAFQARIDGRMHVMTVRPDGTQPRLHTTSGNNEDPSWAPDGRHLVFASDRDGGGLFVLDTVTGRVRQLARGRGYGLPAWSPPLARSDAPASR
jgi:TolB protein